MSGRFDNQLAKQAGTQEGKLPSFPKVFPKAVARFTREMAASIGCPVDFIAQGQLAVASAAIGDSRSVDLGGGWLETACLYACIIGPPGSAKTPALTAAVRPVYRIQQQFDRDYEQAEFDYEQNQEEYEFQLKAAKVTGKHNAQMTLPQKPVKPMPARIITSDATTEALAPILKQNPRGLLMHRDELSGWVKGLNMYRGGKGSDRQFFLQAWATQSVIVDRKGQGTRAVMVPRPFMTILGSIQPDMLSELADSKGRQDGFLDRILFVYPNAGTGQPWPSKPAAKKVMDSWTKAVRRLYRLKMKVKEDGTLCPKIVKLMPDATEILKVWWGKNRQGMQSAAFDTELLGGPFAKFRSHAPRLALIIHCLRYVCQETDTPHIDAESAMRATRLADYFKAHCCKVFAQLRVAPKEKHAERIEEWIRRNGGRCLARDIYRNQVGGIKTESEAKKALLDLEDRGRGECRTLKAGVKESISFALKGIGR